jgi:DNA invertase Pin-like site-specific DNA recombinase
MQSHDTSLALTGQERAALLALLPSAGRERDAVHAQAAAVYARVSTSEQDSIPAQLYSGHTYAARLGVPVHYELQDEGSGLDAARVDYQRLLVLATGGKISHLIVWKADRLSRDDAEFVPVCRRLMALGIEIHDTTTGLLTADTVLFQAFISNVEVRNISQRTSMKMAYLAREGKKMGSPLLGYRRTLTPGVYEIDPAVGPVVLELFERYAGGEGLRGLARWINARLALPWPPPPGQKRGRAAFKHSNLAKLLKNPAYRGINVVGQRRSSKIDGRYAYPREQWDLVPSLSPALVSPELWDRVQARIAAHRSVGQPERTSAPKYALAGLLWCSACDRRMSGHRSKTTAHAPFLEYTCSMCTMSRSAARVEGAVQEALQMVPIGTEAIAAALARLDGNDHAALRAALAVVETQLATLLRGKVLLTKMFRAGEIDAEAYHATQQDDEAEAKELRAERAALEARLQQTTAAQATLDEVAAWLRGLDSWTALLAQATVPEARHVYRETIARAVIDAQAGTLTISWTAPIACLMGTEAVTAPLPAQPSRRLTQPKLPAQTLALIRQLASAEPRPTARQIHQQLQARGIKVGLRTIQRHARTTPARRGRPAKTPT